MNGILTSNEVGWALMQAGLSPFTLDTEMFQIVREGENYIVHTDRLPEIYIEKDEARLSGKNIKGVRAWMEGGNH